MQTAKFKFKIKFKDPAHLHYFKGGIFRGAFGYALKKICCIKKHNTCADCKLKNKCVYARIFEPTDFEREHFFYGKIKDTPRPYVFSFDTLDLREYFEADDSFEFNLVLLNEFINNFPFLLYSIISMGEKGLTKKESKFEIEQVKIINHNNQELTIFENHQLSAIVPEYIITHNLTIAATDNHRQFSPHNNILTVKFITPIRIKQDGKLKDDLSFKDVFNACLRRTALLLFYYDNNDYPIVDYQAIREKIENVEKLEDNTNWFDWR
ncbi:MAG TPA: hypothetical protein PLJ38_12630, partial [bacterium]|nr:hypothetical protein [bacterium]